MRCVVAAAFAAMTTGVVEQASAEPAGVLFAPTYGDPDLREQAGAVSLLLRGALDPKGGGLVPPYELARQGIAPSLERARDVLATASAKFLIVSEIDRSGTSLIGSAHVINADGTIIAKAYGSAPEGALAELATKLSQPLGKAIGVSPATVSDVSVGQLRPFIEAELLLGAKKSAEAARALAAADPLIGLRVPSAAQLARAIASDGSLPLPERLAALSTTGVPNDVLSLSGADTSPTARAYRALASVEAEDAERARRELSDASGKTATKDGVAEPVFQLARASLARLEHKGEARDAAITAMLSAPTPMQLRWLSRLAPSALGRDLEQRMLQAAKGTKHKRLAAVLGLRAAEAGMDVDNALALVSPGELDASERTRLAAVLATATGFQSNRLGCEVAVLSGDVQAAKAAAANLGKTDDAQAALCRGRISWQLGYLGVAAGDLARGGSPFDATRVLLSANDPRAAALALKPAGDEGAQARLGFLANASLAAAEGRATDARSLLLKAALAAPGSWAVETRLADVLELAGDSQGAAAAKARMTMLAGPDTDNSEPVQATIAEVDPGPAAPVARSTALAPRSVPLRKTLDKLLTGFPLELFSKRGVLLAPYGDQDAWWRARTIDVDAFADHLAQALTDPRHDARTIALGPPQPMPPKAEALAKLAVANNAATVVLYRVLASGSVRLLAFDVKTRLAAEIEGTIEPDEAGLLRWNYLVVGPPVVLLAALILWILWVVIRGKGVVEVHIKMDPSGTDEVLCVELVESHLRPQIGDPERFVKLHRADGQRVSANRVTLVNAVSKLRAPAGNYWVHVWGVYQRAGLQYLVDSASAYSQQVKIARGSKQRVDFDLAPSNAELRIRILDEMPSGIALWLDDSTAKVHTNDEGTATLYAQLGTHTLHIDSRGLHIEHEVVLGFARIERLEFNLVRERRLADVSGGLSLKKHTIGPSSQSLADAANFQVELSPEDTANALRTQHEGPRSAPDGMAAGSAPVMPTGGIAIPLARAATSPALAAAQGVAVPQHRATAAYAGYGGANAPATDPELRSTPLSPSLAMPAVGTLLLGRYRISEVLGEGAMGVVFRATDQNLEREVAIKVMSRELRHNGDAMRFFVEEAKALAQLNHSNIVSVFDQASNGDETYLIMEFVDGRTVEAILRDRTKLPVRAALAIIDQLCNGLAYVHGRRIIHRDIKPANIFVSKEKVVKLGDFGLARVMRELSIRRTEIRGTPLYMAPEQITGENVTHRVDLYAVGCTMFELVTGRPPFVDGEVMIHHLTTPPPAPSSFEPSLPPALDELILSCIEKEPDMRIESANAIRDRIRAINQAN